LRQPPERLFQTIAHVFADQALAERALRHRSAGADHNERLEFLGDALLGFVIAEALYAAFPQADEGQLSRLRAALVKREALAEVARELDLGDYLTLGPGELRTGGQSRTSTLADALEAVLGAVYLDGGFEAASGVIRRLFLSRIDRLDPEVQGKDPKTRLQELLQAGHRPLPVYEVLDTRGEQHRQTFRVRCALADRSIEATGSSRRRAEQAAAARMLEALEEIGPDG
jgi:ribonuclease-3